MEINKRIEQLIGKYLREDISETELKELESWYNDYGIEKTFFDEEEKKIIKKRIWGRINNYLVNNNPAGKKKKIHYSSFIIKIAAILFLAIGLYTTYSLINYKEINTTTKYIQKATLRGEKFRIELLDGTKIWLNSETQLQIPEEFNEKTREVFLSGEAFFQVKRNEQKPFIVKTAQSTTKVLGTSFNVKSYPNELTSVTVSSGKVSVDFRTNKRGTNKIILLKDEQVDYSPAEKTCVKSIVKSNAFKKWKDGILKFEEIPLEEAKIILERWFNVEIQILNSDLKKRKITAEYDNESLQNILKSFQFIMNVEFKMAGKAVTIK